MGTTGDTLTWISTITRPPVILSTIFISVFAYTLSNHSEYIVLIVFLLWFSGYGFFDFIHREAKSNLDQRRSIEKKSFPIRTNTNITKNQYLSQKIEILQYQDFKFRVYWINDQFPPNGISYPLCPVCNGDLVEIAHIIFPARISIKLFCKDCKVSYNSKYLCLELVDQAVQAFNVRQQ